ncbi:hypothetical protein KBC03_05080 [Patescibacteria group bacterium]|nr:hypothetical protein [Patescibacteria group bacterium]
MEVFLCRRKMTKEELPAQFLTICNTYGQLMIRDEAIYGMQVHVPLTAERMGTENEYSQIVQDLRQAGYIVVQSLIQTKDFPLIQWSITDPTLLAMIVEEVKQIENTPKTDIVQTIAATERRDSIVAELTNRSEEN